MGKDEFKYLNKELHSYVLGLVKQKGFYPYEYISGFENFIGRLPIKEKFYSSLPGKIKQW